MGRRIKLKIFLKSGESIVFKCKEYKFTYANDTLDYIGYTFKGNNKAIGIVPSQIAAWKVL